MPTDDAPTDEQLLRGAMAEHGAGHVEVAEALYRQLLERSPDHPDALHLRGVLFAQRGQHAAAAASIEQAVALRPGEAMFHNNLGNVYLECGRFDEAEAAYRRAIALDTGRLDAFNNLGVLLSRRGRGPEAERIFTTLMTVAPEFVDARQNLATYYLREGRVADALQVCVDGMITAPRHPSLRRLLGAAYLLLGRRDEAITIYRHWLADEPDNPLPRYHLQACTGEGVPERAPDDYVRRVFDGFAHSFDAKLADLSYRAPELCAEAVSQLAGAPAKALDVIDAGCGTGLCGPLLAPWARRLAGVDLSVAMLERARTRAVYDELVAAELVAFLTARPAAADLVVSADTLCYFGRLDGFAQAVAGTLRAGGTLVFTLESHADDEAAPDFRLHEHGRYSHRRRYVEQVLLAAGLESLQMRAVVLRMEAGAPVDGWLVGARRTGRD